MRVGVRIVNLSHADPIHYRLSFLELPVSRSIKESLTHSLTHSSCSLNDRWGIKGDRATTFLYSSLSSAFRAASPNPNSVHSDILSSHLFFFCLPFLLRYKNHNLYQNMNSWLSLCGSLHCHQPGDSGPTLQVDLTSSEGGQTVER